MMPLLLLVTLLSTCFIPARQNNSNNNNDNNNNDNNNNNNNNSSHVAAHHYDHEFEHNPQFETRRDRLWHSDDDDEDDYVGDDVSKEELEEKREKKRKKKLGSLFHEMDVDDDTMVTEPEMVTWLRNGEKKWEMKQASDNLQQHDLNRDGYLTKNEYKTLFRQYIPEDKEERRIRRADVNADGKLDSVELAAFMFPHSHPHMRGLDALQLVDDMDKNNDDVVTLHEYIGSFDYNSKSGQKERNMIVEEKEYFRTTLDKNGDGKLDEDEVISWMLPPHDDEDVHQAEVKEVLERSDVDGDGKLSKEEMQENYHVFVQSDATDFADYLRHDEL